MSSEDTSIASEDTFPIQVSEFLMSFSSDLLMDCLVNQIKSMAIPKITYHSSTAQIFPLGKKWIKLADTLLGRLKENINEPQTLIKFIPDVKVLLDTQNIAKEQLTDERWIRDIDILCALLSCIHDFGSVIVQKQNILNTENEASQEYERVVFAI